MGKRVIGARERWWTSGEQSYFNAKLSFVVETDMAYRAKLLKRAKQGKPEAVAELWSRYKCRVITP